MVALTAATSAASTPKTSSGSVTATTAMASEIQNSVQTAARYYFNLLFGCHFWLYFDMAQCYCFSRKITLSRNRSPTGHSPATKSRKASSASAVAAATAAVTSDSRSDQATPSAAAVSSKETKKTWKGKVARQWKKMHDSSSSSKSSSQTGCQGGYPEGGSIGVPLEECPTRASTVMVAEEEGQTYMERVPHLVKVCTSIVEERGLEIVGIYRVPGNNAAVTHLTEAVNRTNRYSFVQFVTV